MRPSKSFRPSVYIALAVSFALPSCGLAAPSASPFDGDRAYTLLEEIVALGPRVSGTKEAEQTRAIIRRELEAAGVPLEEHSFEAATPLGARNMVNLVAVIKGTEPGVIILGNHYDTKYFPDFEFVGANDGGSTTAWMIEMARTLGPTREGHTLWLCWFDGEEAFLDWMREDSLYGSRAMVKRLREEGRLADVRAMINVDMIGDCQLTISKDRDAPEWMTNLVWRTAKKLGHQNEFNPLREGIEDDHYPFRRAGVPAMDIIDFRYGGGRASHDMNWHTTRDRMDLVCASSLKIVGDVVYKVLERLDDALRQLEAREGELED